MSHHQDFGALFAHWGVSFPAFDGDAHARRPRGDRPDRPGGGGGGGSGGSGGGGGGATPSGPYTSGDLSVPDANEYNIKITFLGSGWTAELRQAFISAADAISDFIVGDVPAAGNRRSAVDDISITASLLNIDGPGKVLGAAGPDALRGNSLPYKGSMLFDIADTSYYQSLGLFDDIVLHEMLHTIGFGTIWSDLNLINGGFFTGALANAVYPGTDLIPLELTGGPGTAYSHWSEAVFDDELMTGYINNDNTLSYMTIASLGDLGYTLSASYVPPSFI
jgi:hypothetical protein